MLKTSLKIFFIIVSLLVSVLSFAAEAPEKEIEMVLGVDKMERLDFSPASDVELSEDNIIDYKIIPQRRQIILKGLKKGSVTVTIKNVVGDIKSVLKVAVIEDANSKVVKELREFLGEVEGITVGVKGGFVVIEGKLVVPSDIGRLMLVLAQYSGVLNFVELSPHTQSVVARKMQDEIQGNGMPNVTVRVINGAYWLEGIVNKVGLDAKAQRIAEAYLPDRLSDLSAQSGKLETVDRKVILNFINVNEPPPPVQVPKLIKVIAQFVELTKDYNKIFGFNWAPTISTGGETGTGGGAIAFGRGGDGSLTTSSSGTLSGTISNLFPKLAAAKSAGYARVIQSGMIIAKDRQVEPAKLQKTATTKFQLGTGDFAKAESNIVGFTLEVKPAILEGEKIELGLGLTVSSNKSEMTVLNNTIQTAVVVKSRDTAVIGGVVINEKNTAFDKDPPGGSVTVTGGTTLFSFLRSKSYATARSQFVVFITPEIVESASADTADVKQRFRVRGR